MITVIGIFEDVAHADEVCEYLLANEFTADELDQHTHADNPDAAGALDRIGAFFSHLFDDEDVAQAHATAGRRGTIVTVHATSARLAQEAVDALNNYGAVDVDAFNNNTGGSGLSTKLVERTVAEDMRLRG
jgi:hypothetical protein